MKGLGEVKVVIAVEDHLMLRAHQVVDLVLVQLIARHLWCV